MENKIRGFQKGHLPWNKGKKCPEISKRIKDEYEKGRVVWNKGKKCSSISEGMKKFYLTDKGKDNRKKQSGMMMYNKNPTKGLGVRNKLKDYKHWTKNGNWSKKEIKEKLGKGTRGKTYEEIHGEEKAKILKINSSESRKGEKSHWYGEHHTEKTKEKLRQAAYKRKPKYKNTKPEIFLQELLSKENIKFEPHKQIFGVPDIFIEPNICIFVDGEYWHNYPYFREIDLNVNLRLKQEGYKILRFWVKNELYKDPTKCLNKIKRLLALK